MAKDNNRNAFRHGLSASHSGDKHDSHEVQRLGNALAGPEAGPDLINAAFLLARMLLKLGHVEGVRKALVEHQHAVYIGKQETRPNNDLQPDKTEFFGYAIAYCNASPQLTKIRRYERRAHSQFMRAMRGYMLAFEK